MNAASFAALEREHMASGIVFKGNSLGRTLQVIRSSPGSHKHPSR